MNGDHVIYQNHDPKMNGHAEDNPPPLPARGGAAPPPIANGSSAPNHGVIPFFPFHQFPGRSVKPNRKFQLSLSLSHDPICRRKQTQRDRKKN